MERRRHQEQLDREAIGKRATRSAASKGPDRQQKGDELGGFTKVAEDAATEPGTAQGHRGERNENRLLQWRQHVRELASGASATSLRGVVRGALTVALSRLASGGLVKYRAGFVDA
jgi:hypothetical protein